MAALLWAGHPRGERSGVSTPVFCITGSSKFPSQQEWFLCLRVD